eukprot:TRINITY_DN26840_c0_g1_i1.p1 TRINITY_DN26840_c0_g1~~TRINITY_DN26840_c0_g1_i1.p1  ORF type:complete len:161 (+),score=30.22 TRINITY_DN26840_c0_g1_i1:157-639(+)
MTSPTASQDDRAAKREADALEQSPVLKRQKPDAVPASRLRHAQFWYYMDQSGEVQGPFYPGELREWMAAGYFSPQQLVAPSYYGEVPQDFTAIEELFSPISAAFVCGEGVADQPPREDLPPDAAPVVEQQQTDEKFKPSMTDSALYRRDYADFTRDVHRR